MPDFSTTRKVAVKEAEKRTILQEQAHAVDVLEKTLDRPSHVPADEVEMEQKQAGFLKRWAILVAAGGLEVTMDDGSKKPASELNMPVAEIIGCGARMSVLGSDQRVANWLLNGPVSTMDEAQQYETRKVTDSPAVSKTQEKNNGELAHTRGGGTHAFEGDKEVKTMNPLKAARADGRHVGVDLAIGGHGESDVHGRPITRDGLSGHAYMHFSPDSANMMIGMESCTDPKKSNGYAQVDGQFGTHTWRGGPEPLTAVGIRPWGPELQKEFAAERKGYEAAGAGGDDPLKEAARPAKRYDCLKIDLKCRDENDRHDPVNMAIERIIRLDDKDFGSDIVRMKPCASVADFETKYANRNTEAGKSAMYDTEVKDAPAYLAHKQAAVEAAAQVPEKKSWFARAKESVSNAVSRASESISNGWSDFKSKLGFKKEEPVAETATPAAPITERTTEKVAELSAPLLTKEKQAEREGPSSPVSPLTPETLAVSFSEPKTVPSSPLSPQEPPYEERMAAAKNDIDIAGLRTTAASAKKEAAATPVPERVVQEASRAV